MTNVIRTIIRAALGATCLGACAESTTSALVRDIPRSRWRVLHREPGASAGAFAVSPDGRLYLGTTTGLYTASPGSGGAWERVATFEQYPIRFALPTDTSLFAITRGCSALFRWTRSTGLRPERTPIADSTWQVHGSGLCFFMRDVALAATGEVIAVASPDVLMWKRASGWSVDSSPELLAALGEGRPDALWAVSGSHDRTMVSGRVTLEWTGGEWRRVRWPPADSAAERACLVQAIAVTPSTVHLAGGARACILQVGPSGAGVLPARRLAIDNLYDGGVQADGSAMFWTAFDALVRLDDQGDVRTIRIPDLRPLRGAAWRPPVLLVAGNDSLGAVVVAIDDAFGTEAP